MSPLARRFAWFAAAIVVPCAALLWLGLRLLRQEEEIDRQRAKENRQLRLDKARRDLLAVLEPALQASAPSSRVAFHGFVRSGKAIAGWEEEPGVLALRRALKESAYLAALGSPGEARGPAFPGVAGDFLALQRAVALGMSADHGLADTLFSELASKPVRVTDDFGVPLALYAAARLPSPQKGQALERILQEILDRPLGLSATGIQMAISLAKVSGPVEVVPRLESLYDNARAGEAFVESYSRTGGASVIRWQAFGREPYLVGYLAGATAGDFTYRAVGARGLLPGVELSLEEGQELGEPLPGLRAKLPAPAGPDAPRQRPLIVAVLVIAFAIALFGSLLLGRDFRREAQLAALRTQFVAGVSHELRTPLTAIRMFTEALHDNPALPAGQRQEYLATMLRENERLSRLVENVLEFSRIERNRQTYVLRPVSLLEVVRPVLLSLQPLLDQGGFHLETRLDEGLPGVLADPDALGQAISNLIGNAMKYSGTAREIRLEALRQDGRVLVRVTDRGIGIPRSEQRRIFASFYRAPVPENSSIQGAGLGLTLVRHVMQGHNGEVRVDSEPGRGSTFTLALPVPPEETEA